MERTAKSDLRAICKAICNTCYVDDDVAIAMLMSKDIDPDITVSGNFDKDIVALAIEIVKGWVETSRSEGGISTAIDIAGIKANLMSWSYRYGLRADELMFGVKTTKNGSNMW